MKVHPNGGSDDEMKSWAQHFEDWAQRFKKVVPPAFHVMTNWNVELYYQKKKKKNALTLRDSCYRFLASPNSSTSALLFSSFVLLISASHTRAKPRLDCPQMSHMSTLTIIHQPPTMSLLFMSFFFFG